MSGTEEVKEQTEVVMEDADKPMPSAQQEEEVIKKKYGGIVPKKPPLISKDHERAYFDSADCALGKQGVEKPKGPLEAPRPKLQSEEDLALKQQLELYVERVPALQMVAPESTRLHKESKESWKKDEYESKSVIGSGCFGQVLKVVRKSDQSSWALKRVELVSQECEKEDNPLYVFTKHMARECMTYDLQHENVVRLEDTYIDGHYMCFIFEHMKMNLSQYVDTYPNQFLRCLLRHLLRGIEYVHSEHIVHRDLKPSNILIDLVDDEPLLKIGIDSVDDDKPLLKIGDFGLARFITKKEMTPGAGSTNYHPPEVLLGSTYDMAADMWSIGCIFAFMASGDHLFNGTNESAVFKDICRVIGTPNEENSPDACALPGWYLIRDSSSESSDSPAYPRKEFIDRFSSRLGPLGLDLLMELLSFDPVKRISATGALEHPYILEQ